MCRQVNVTPAQLRSEMPILHVLEGRRRRRPGGTPHWLDLHFPPSRRRRRWWFVVHDRRGRSPRPGVSSSSGVMSVEYMAQLCSIRPGMADGPIACTMLAAAIRARPPLS